MISQLELPWLWGHNDSPEVTRDRNYFRKMSPKNFLCTRCGKDYAYKGGLSAHIKNKHPLKPVEKEKNKQVKKPVEPAPAAKQSVSNMKHLNTQEVDNLLAEEEEFYDAIDGRRSKRSF